MGKPSYVITGFYMSITFKYMCGHTCLSKAILNTISLNPYMILITLGTTLKAAWSHSKSVKY